MRLSIILIFSLALVASGCAGNSPDTAPEQNNTDNGQSPPTGDNDSSQDSDTEPSNNTDSTVTVTYTDSGFQPSTVTIEQGQTVVWESETSGMWVASNQHPVHSQYSGTSRSEHCSSGDQTSAAFDQCSAGDRFSFTFEKTGEWSYHNHRYSAHQGTVIVE